MGFCVLPPPVVPTPLFAQILITTKAMTAPRLIDPRVAGPAGGFRTTKLHVPSLPNCEYLLSQLVFFLYARGSHKARGLTTLVLLLRRLYCWTGSIPSLRSKGVVLVPRKAAIFVPSLFPFSDHRGIFHFFRQIDLQFLLEIVFDGLALSRSPSVWLRKEWLVNFFKIRNRSKGEPPPNPLPSCPRDGFSAKKLPSPQFP